MSSRSRVPLVRSRSMLMLVTKNIVVKGKIPSNVSATWSNAGRASNIWFVSTSSRLGTTSRRATVRRSPRSCASTRRAVAAVIPGGGPDASHGRPGNHRPPDQAQEGLFEVGGAGGGADGVGCVVGDKLPSRISSSRSQRPASSMTWLETNRVVPAAARAWKRAHRSWRSTGSSPTVGSSRTSSSGSASRAQASETRVPARHRTACSPAGPRGRPGRRRRAYDVLMLFYLLSADELRELLGRLGYANRSLWVGCPRKVSPLWREQDHSVGSQLVECPAASPRAGGPWRGIRTGRNGPWPARRQRR